MGNSAIAGQLMLKYDLDSGEYINRNFYTREGFIAICSNSMMILMLSKDLIKD